MRSTSELADTPSYGSGELHAVRRADGNRSAPFLALGCSTVDSYPSHEATYHFIIPLHGIETCDASSASEGTEQHAMRSSCFPMCDTSNRAENMSHIEPQGPQTASSTTRLVGCKILRAWPTVLGQRRHASVDLKHPCPDDQPLLDRGPQPFTLNPKLLCRSLASTKMPRPCMWTLRFSISMQSWLGSTL